MSAPFPESDQRQAAPPRDLVGSAREQALLREIEILRAENQRLRHLQAGTPGAPPETDLLLPLDQALPSVNSPTDTAPDPLEYQALFAALASAFPIGIFRTDGAGIVTHVDDALLRIFGLDTQDFLQQGWLRRVHPDDLEHVKTCWSQGVALARSQSMEFRLQRPDGEVVHLSMRNVPVHDAEGQFLSQLGFVQEITELRTLEADARLKDELNRQIIASSPDCTKVLDLQGHVLQMTAQGCRLVEVDNFEQVRGSDWATWWPEGGQALARAAIGSACQGENARFVAFGETFKGTPKWWDTTLSPIRDAQGRPVMLLAISRDITDLHQQQEAIQRFSAELEDRVRERTVELAAANARLSRTLREAQDLYDQAPCGYYSLDERGVVQMINQTALQWLGLKREDVVGRLSFRDLVQPEYLAQQESRRRLLSDTGQLEPEEVGIKMPDGRPFIALASSTAVYDETGAFLRTNSTLLNITERKAAEQALRENQRFLQTVTDHVPGLIAYLDASLCFRFANAEHQRMYGMDPAKIIGRPVSECVAAEVWAEIGPSLRAALAGQVQSFETWRQMIDGTPVYVSTKYLPDIHEGRVQGVFVQTIDITERKRIEERVRQLNDELEQRIQERSAELLESEQRFRLMVDNLREYCIFFMDADGLITDWTDSAQRLEGYAPTQVLGRHYSVLFRQHDPTDAMDSANQMLRLAASRGQHELHSWHERKDGSRYWSHSLLIALRDDGGELRGFAKINRDMSDAKRLDDLMRNINDELENRVAERTEQLLAANKDLESFSYSVSHDLRSPLRHISSFVSLLEEHLDNQIDETTRRYLGTIGGSARHMSQLIDGLLAFSRLGRSAVNLTAVDLTLLVDAVVSQLAHDTEGRVVDWVVAPDLPVVQGDALLLREVWANLLGNAYKYTRPRERARIEVGWSVDPVAGYTFYVRDNGVGFDTKYSQKLFGVFQRLHRASEFEGTGIGLALTRRILERHGGSIWAESQLGEGSVFYFSLPFEGASPTDFSRDTMPAALEP